MFGVLRGCGKHLDQVQHQEWWSHICGLCLTLRDQHGQAARMSTNYDAALLSVLYEAQSEQPPEAATHACPLRRFNRAAVIPASRVGAQYAASVALLAAGTRINDHLADGDTWLRRIPLLPGKVAKSWTRRGREGLAKLDFDPAEIEQQTAAQAGLERQADLSFEAYSAPTEAAVGAAFRHTAELAERPENAAPLEQIGRMYGRIMFLLDSYRDYHDDQRNGVFNALARCFEPAATQSRARDLFKAAYAGIKDQFAQLKLGNAQLLHTLLIAQLLTTGSHTLNAFDPGRPPGFEDLVDKGAEEASKAGSTGLSNCFACGDCCSSCIPDDGTFNCCCSGCDACSCCDCNTP